LLRLTLNRPGKRNALDAALCRQLVETLDAAAADPGVGAILLLASGNVFCAGMDLAEIEQGGDTDEISALHERLFTAGARLTKPLIAGVHGAALGGGTGLVANCHIVVASAGATFGLTEIRLGLWPFLVYRAVEAALGERRTLELSLTGRIFAASEAREYALVHEIAADASARAEQIVDLFPHADARLHADELDDEALPGQRSAPREQDQRFEAAAIHFKRFARSGCACL